ncbi:MAG: hypothetical protein RLP98_13525 [Devosia sp.]
MAKTANLALRIEPVIKAGLEKAAAADRRTVSNYVEALIVADLKEKGIAIDQGDATARPGVAMESH